METKIECFIAINEQPDVSPTYKSIACSILVDDNDSDAMNGIRIPCEIDVNTDIADACVSTNQGIRITITVGGEDVSDSIVGNLSIKHDLNAISTFSFNLGNSKYSPLTDSNIAVNSIVIITVFINGEEMKLFTGLVDGTRTTYTGGYNLGIYGRDYGKKLLDKTLTLISVQESAQRKYRGSIVKYIAEQAGITSLNVPIGDPIVTDHSFQDQNTLNMVQKENAIEGWFIRFDEEAVMQVRTKNLKTYADWDYGEDEFVKLGLDTSDEGIINKVIILGAIFEEEVISIEHDEIEQQVEVPTEEYQEDSVTVSKSFSAGEVVKNWSYEDANFKVTAKYIGFTKPNDYIFPKYQNYEFNITKLNSDLTVTDKELTVTGGAIKYGSFVIHRGIGSTLGDEENWVPGFTEQAFAISIVIKTKELVAGGSEWITENIPTETTVSTVTYTQVKATVTDPVSIALYGERKPNNEGTLSYPLAETAAQCKRVGENVILDSHNRIQQPDFEVPFNPKMIVGQTIELTDKKIGYDESKYLAAQVHHEINVSADGKLKARTKFAGVYYA